MVFLPLPHTFSAPSCSLLLTFPLPHISSTFLALPSPFQLLLPSPLSSPLSSPGSRALVLSPSGSRGVAVTNVLPLLRQWVWGWAGKVLRREKDSSTFDKWNPSHSRAHWGRLYNVALHAPRPPRDGSNPQSRIWGNIMNSLGSLTWLSSWIRYISKACRPLLIKTPAWQE